MGGRFGWKRRTALAVTAIAVVAGGLGTAPRAAADGVRYVDPVFEDYTVESDLYYGRDDYTGPQRDYLLDVLEPAGDTATNRAAVVWVHGGYFKRGSKTDSWYREAREQFVKAGYVVFSINYRLDPSLPEGLLGVIQTLRLEEYIQEAKNATYDAQAAVRWVRAHAADYDVNPNKIAVAGHSAGGIIALGVGFNSEDPGDRGTPGVSSKVAAIVSSAGGTLPGILATPGLNDPPLLVSHGVADDVVPYPASLPACVMTVALLNVCEKVIDLDQKHGQFGFEHWRDFLYRRMINPPPIQLPLSLKLFP